MQTSWKELLRDILIPAEPPLPNTILTPELLQPFAGRNAGDLVCIKVSAAYELPYPFSVSRNLAELLVREIHTANPLLRIVLTEGGVGDRAVRSVAERLGLTDIPHCEFLDSEEANAPIFVRNTGAESFRAEGFSLSPLWANADIRVLLTTCKLRSHHFRRWYSGGCRNLIGLLPRSEYRLPGSRRSMRSALHQQGFVGMDEMVADLYGTAGSGVLTVLDARLLARQDEHIPLRFTKRTDKLVVADDPYLADLEMARQLKLPFIPPYLALVARAKSIARRPLEGADSEAAPIFVTA